MSPALHFPTQHYPIQSIPSNDPKDPNTIEKMLSKLIIPMSLEGGTKIEDIRIDIAAKIVGTLAHDGSNKGTNLKDALRMFK